MKTCKKCGSQNDDDRKICSTCGEKFVEVPSIFMYFVKCSRCNNNTEVEDINQKVFYCATCKKEYTIDGIDFSISRKSTTNPSIDETQEPELILEETKSHHQFHIPKSGGIFGRYGEYEPEFFQEKRFGRVSGRHIIIIYENNGWYITPNSETNDTYIDGQTLKPAKKGICVQVKNGYIIGLADIYFKVSILGGNNASK